MPLDLVQRWAANPDAVELVKEAAVTPKRHIPLPEAQLVKKADEPAMSDGPPNYRHADLTGPSCAKCEHFQVGKCTKYGSIPVQADYVCDSFQQAGHSFDRSIQRLGHATQPVEPLSSGQSFKLGFVERCKELKMTTDELADAAEFAIGHVKSAALDWGTLGAGALVGIPTAWGLGRLVADRAHRRQQDRYNQFFNENRVDVQDFQNLELLNEYKRMTEEVQNKLKERLQRKTTPVSPKTRSYF